MSQQRPKEVDPNMLPDTQRVEGGLAWRDCADPAFTMNGLASWAAEHRLCRLPQRAKGVVRDEVWDLAQRTSGARLRFATDSSRLALRIEHEQMPVRANFGPMGHSGIDLYVGPPAASLYWATTRPDGVATAYESELFVHLPRQTRQITLYLPTYNGVAKLAVGLDADAAVRPPAPFALDKPVVFYGTSITQGGCNSRPGAGFVPAVCRQLGIDFVNLGFSGNGKGEPEVRQLVAEIDAALFVLDYDANTCLGELRQTLDPFYALLRERWPDTPILALSKPWRSAHLYLPDVVAGALGTQRHIRDRVAAWRAAGDANVHFQSGYELIGESDTEAFVDGVHPNDLGFARMAEGLAPMLRRILSG